MKAMRTWRALLAAAALLVAALPAAAVDERDLLPVDEAFALSARATSRDGIDIEWKIADGYYLYRHRIGAQVLEGGFEAQPLRLPPGTPYTDEFFGDVETYRGRLAAVLPGQATGGADRVTLQVKYQGCADLGICYPPQTRTLQVVLPPATGAGGAEDPGFSTFARTLAGGGVLRPAGAAGARDAPPLPEEQAFAFEAIAADGNTVLMRFTPAPGYYLYRDRNSFRIEGADGIAAGTPRWPKGVAHHDEHFGDVTVYFDQVEVELPLRRTVPGAVEAVLVATFQGCQDEGICYPPMTRRVGLSLPPGNVNATPASQPTDDAASAAEATGGGDAAVTPEAGDAPSPPPDAAADNAMRSPPPAKAALPPGGVSGALLLALLGGLVLNLMPCVLPILSLKALGLAQSGESRQRARSHALWYTAGVLSAFAVVGALALALRAGGQALGWGFQLQQPWFVAALVYLMFAVGLSLSGVFTLGIGVGRAGSTLASKTGPAGDFFTGVLACVVASPCIAPFMGSALAFAFTAPAALAMLVFLALGLGLALPFLLVGFVPALAGRLPRPGAWMETFKQVLAFPMYLAAAWLLWVLGRQRGVDAMALVAAGLAVFALALWWLERRRWRPGVLARALALVLLAVSLLPVLRVSSMAAPARAAGESAWQVPYSAERLRALREAGRVVFVNMTADWCVTCKANERRVLSRPAFREALEAADAVYMVGDWTDVDPAIGAYLAEHGAVGVPLYVVYPAGGGEGEVLPAILTGDIVAAALERARR